MSHPPSVDSHSNDEGAQESVQRLKGSKETSLTYPNKLRPPPTSRSDRLGPPPTRHGSRASRCVASTMVASARKRVQPRPPTPDDIRRVTRKLQSLAIA